MTRLSRREFLKLAALTPGLIVSPRWFDEHPPEQMCGRVTRATIYSHTQPSLSSPRLQRFERDTLVDLDESLLSPFGPAYNSRWYRAGTGFLHSAYLQRVERAHLNPPLEQVPESGVPGEITVPLAASLYKNRQGQWAPLYRLYYASLHWITRLFEGPDGRPWYALTDEWLKVDCCVPAENVRPLIAAEMAPIARDIPPENKRILISLSDQSLTAVQGDRVVLRAAISSGQRFMETPTGEFRIQRKLPSKHMGNGALTADPNAYEFPGVPWTSFFTNNGIALHGAYWHDNFGQPTSSGCVNLRPADALFLFRWTDPPYDPHIQSRSDWRLRGEGTRVVVS
jgi:lipoprotein-anchoring transpeptidase ErfK/SrfK